MSAAMERPVQQTRSRSKSTFSFKSDKSQDSHNKQQQTHQRTPSKELEKQHLHASTKADPNAAMNEVQPIATALEKPTLQSLRSFQHTDTNGQPIAEPDLSNPTRSRWERPLDTIRSFEAAIDNEYKRRSYATRPGSEAIGSDVMSGFASRRSSYYGGGGYEQNRYSQVGSGGGYGGGYYGSRQAAAQRDSWADNGYGPGPGPGVGGPGPRTRYNRMQSDPGHRGYGPGHNPYPSQGHQQSRDTVITGGSNGRHSEPYSTDPSSENSSIERGGPVGGPVMRPDMGEQYGFSGFGNGPQPILEEYSGDGAGPPNGYYPNQHNVAHIPPPVPAKTGPPPPVHNPNMIKLSQTNSPPGQGPPPANGARPNVLSRKSTDGSDKRRSWFKRRFSKN